MSRNLLAAIFIGVSFYGCASSCDGHDDPENTPAATQQNGSTQTQPVSSRGRTNLGPKQPLVHYGDMVDK